jgi:copper resistance protein B
MTVRFRAVAALAGLALLMSVVPSNAQGSAQSHDGHDAVQQTGQSTPDASSHEDHSAHEEPAARQQYPADMPRITDEDRAAAFPHLEGHGHAVHDTAIHYYALLDQIELQAGDGVTAGSWENHTWIGGDVNRFWLRTEGRAEGRGRSEAQAHVLFGRAIHRWWDVVAGFRQDFRPGPGRTWAAIGVQGLAPYRFELEATAYVGESGRNHVRLEVENDLLLTNRLIAQPLVELEIFGKADPDRHIDAGLSSGDFGLRVRYEVRRELAPYVGFTWNRKFLGTADLNVAAGLPRGGARLATGVRVWF